ncbi:MAG: DUF305 domain-containing protein [Devosia sp.]
MIKITLAALAFALSAAPALAVELPPICLANAQHDMNAMGAMDMPMTGPDEAHQDLMGGMDKMNADMMAGGTAHDIDVAFICSMIPHHQGAIDMAKAELAHGDDPWAKELAQNIIAAQEKEIADMMKWLAELT